MTRLKKRKIRRFMTKLHDAIIKAITVIAGVVFMFSVSALDDPTYGMMFCKVALVCAAWIAIFCKANGYFYGDEDEY